MDKSFDTSVLVAKLKELGLPLAEEAAEKLVAAVLDWVKESAAAHPNAIVKAAVPLAIETLKPILEKELNKIDGQEG